MQSIVAHCIIQVAVCLLMSALLLEERHVLDQVLVYLQALRAHAPGASWAQH